MKKLVLPILALLILSFSVGFVFGRHARPKTLWIGDSIVCQAPVEGIKHAAGWATIAFLEETLPATLWPGVKYNRIIIMAGTAELARGRDISDVRVDIDSLAKKVEKMHNIKPIIIDPLVIQGFADAPDGLHLTGPAYARLLQSLPS